MSLYAKINNMEYPIIAVTNYQDTKWNNRQSIRLFFNENYNTVKSLLADKITWALIEKETNEKDTDDMSVTEIETDMSDYCIAGEITDHRDGRVSIKMGKKTNEEQLKEIEEAYND